MDKLFFNYKEQFLEACNITGCVELFLDEKPSVRLKFSQKVRIKLILDEQGEGKHGVRGEDNNHTSALESVSIINSDVENTEDIKDVQSDSSMMRNNMTDSSPRRTRGATTRSAYAIGKGLGTRSSKTVAAETNKPPARAAAKSRKQPVMRCMVQKDYTLSACLYPDKPQKESRSASSTSSTRGKRKAAATHAKTLAPDRRLRTSSESRKPRVQRLVCKFCDKSFPDITVHRAHRRNPDCQTSCVVCEAQFPSHGELFLHCFQLHGAEFCQRRFPDIELSTDVIWPGGKKILRKKIVQCPVCSKEFLYHNMFDHILGHFAELSYKCCTCGENLKARHVYLSHCEDHLAKLAGTRKKQRGRRRRTVSEEDTMQSSSSRDAQRHSTEGDSPDDDESEEEDEEEMDTTLPQAVSNKHQVSTNTKSDRVSHAETTYDYSGTAQKSSSSGTQPTNTKTFQCKYCKETFPTSAKLRRHKRVPRASITCHTCGTVVSSQALMIIHEYEVHNIDHRMARPDGELDAIEGGDESMLTQPNNPRVCDKTQENDQRPTPTQFVPCPVCSSQVRRLYLPQHIMRLHTKEYLFRCCICQFPCSSHGKYKEHCSTHIGLGKKGRFTCSNCPQVFATQSEFVKHSQIHKTICHFCQVDFKHVALVERHYETEHSDQLFNCNQCNKRFAKEKNFKDHLRNHRFKTRQPCPKCGLMVKILKTHMETQHPEPGNEACCPICGKRLKHEIGLRNHLRRHHASSSGETYPCPQCPKTFPNQDYLRAHINRHLGKSKIYECPICGKQCKERYNLKTHMQIHSATKRFTCLICQQGFNYKASLLGHMRSRHQQEVQFQC